MKAVLEQWGDGQNWAQFFACLAWERFEPVLPDLQLADLDLPSIRPIARAYIGDCSSMLLAMERDRVPPSERPSRLQPVLDGTLARLGGAAGERTVARVLTVAAGMPSFGLRTPAYYHWALGIFSYWPELPFNDAPPRFPQAVAQLFNATLARWHNEEIRPLDERLLSLEDTAPSDLEIEVTLPDPRGVRNSFPHVRNYLYVRPTKRLWSDIRSVLPPEDLDDLIVWLNRQDRAVELSVNASPSHWRGLDDQN